MKARPERTRSGRLFVGLTVGPGRGSAVPEVHQGRSVARRKTSTTNGPSVSCLLPHDHNGSYGQGQERGEHRVIQSSRRRRLGVIIQHGGPGTTRQLGMLASLPGRPDPLLGPAAERDDQLPGDVDRQSRQGRCISPRQPHRHERRDRINAERDAQQGAEGQEGPAQHRLGRRRHPPECQEVELPSGRCTATSRSPHRREAQVEERVQLLPPADLC